MSPWQLPIIMGQKDNQTLRLSLRATNQYSNSPQTIRYAGKWGKYLYLQWRIYIVKFWTRAPPPGGPNSFNFMQFLGKFGKIVCWRPPPGELAPPPRGNPRSATDLYPEITTVASQRFIFFTCKRE